MTFHCVGYAGIYPFAPGQQVRWRPMHTSSLQRSALLFEQDMLPRCSFRDEELPPLRLTLCGVVWDGITCYGQSLESLLTLQKLFDAQWPECLNRFEGDFSLCYLDGQAVSLYRSLTCTRELYYCVTETDLRWSTSPFDLFPNRQPTLDDVDQEMAAIMTATGLAAPERSVYHQLCRLPAGQRICFSPDSTSQTFHYDYVVHEDNTQLPYPEAVKRLREYVEGAVARAFSSCSSCHMFVSGGLDTAVIAYEAARLGKEVHGYHWTWDLPNRTRLRSSITAHSRCFSTRARAGHGGLSGIAK